MFVRFENSKIVEKSEDEKNGFIFCYSSNNEIKIGDIENLYIFYQNGSCVRKEGDALWLADPSSMPITMKIVDGVVIEKTNEELLEEGIITRKQYNDIILPSLYNELSILDEKAVRPLRAIMSGMGNDYDKEKLKEIEKRAEEVRTKIKELENE